MPKSTENWKTVYGHGPVRPRNGIVKISVYNGTYFRTLRPEKVLQTLLTKDEKSGRRSTQGLPWNLAGVADQNMEKPVERYFLTSWKSAIFLVCDKLMRLIPPQPWASPACLWVNLSGWTPMVCHSAKRFAQNCLLRRNTDFWRILHLPGEWTSLWDPLLKKSHRTPQKTPLTSPQKYLRKNLTDTKGVSGVSI